MEIENELDRIDREWEAERERYLITSKRGRRYVPSTGAAVVVGLFSVSMALIWIMSSLALAHNLGVLAGVFPLFGMVFLVGGGAISLYQFRKGKRYQDAFHAYQLRRSTARDRLKE